MALADTARLLATLDFKDNLSPGTSSAMRGVSGLESKVGGLQAKLGNFASNLRGGIGSALGTFGGRLKQVASAGAGLLGLGGLFAGGFFLKDAISEAQEFGDASIRMAKLTGVSVDAASRLVDVLGYVGIAGEKANSIAGMYEKNVGKLAETKKKAAAFEKEYGLRLTDNSGHVLKFNQQLLESADFFNNKSIPAHEKAIVLSKLYGRGWQDLIPILSKGRKGIEEAQRSALHLSEEDLKVLKANKEATREWDDALGDLKVRIGIDILPVLTDLVKKATEFLNTHGEDVRDFIKGAFETAQKAAEAIGGFIDTASKAWDSIPPDVRDMLIKGVVADRTINFLFGFSPIEKGAEVVVGALGTIVGNLSADLIKTGANAVKDGLISAGIGKAFVQPVFVTNMGVGGLGGAGAAGGAAAAGIGLAGWVASIAGVVVPLIAAQKLFIEPGLQEAAGRNITATEKVIASGDPAKIAAAIGGLKASVNSLDPLKRALYELNADGVKVHTEGLLAALTAAYAKSLKGQVGDPAVRASEREDRAAEEQKAKLDAVRDAQEATRIALTTKTGQTTTQVRASGSRIEGAIRALDLTNRISIYIPGVGTRTYETGGTLGRTGGSSGVFGPGHGA